MNPLLNVKFAVLILLSLAIALIAEFRSLHKSSKAALQELASAREQLNRTNADIQVTQLGLATAASDLETIRQSEAKTRQLRSELVLASLQRDFLQRDLEQLKGFFSIIVCDFPSQKEVDETSKEKELEEDLVRSKDELVRTRADVTATKSLVQDSQRALQRLQAAMRQYGSGNTSAK